MNVNRRTLTLLIVAVAVIGGVYAITWWQRARETSRLLSEVQSTDHGMASEAMMSLHERVPSVRGDLLDLIRHADPNVRWRAALLLGEASDSASRDALVTALNDEAPTVRVQAILSLGKRDATGSADKIALMASDDAQSVAVRTAAMQALRMLRTPTHLAEASAIAGDRPPPPPPEDDEAFEDYVDETALLRQEAVRTVAVLGGLDRSEPGALERPFQDAADLLVASIDPDEEHNSDVRGAACYALGDLAKQVRDEELHRQTVRALIAAMNDEVGDVRIAAAHTLRLVPVPANLRDSFNRAMNSAINDDHYWVRKIAEEAVRGG